MDHGSSLNNSFDFNTQAGVMSLLASIRASALSPAEKNELRDLVFLYTNGGGDVSVRIALEQKLTTHKITQVPSKVVAATQPDRPALAFGSSRPSPVFKTPNIATVVPTPAPAAPIVVAPVVSPVTEVAAVAPTPTPVSTPAPTPVVVPPPPVAAPAPVVETVLPPTPTPPPAPVAVPVAAPTPAPEVVPVANTNHLDRIREIKTAVNSKVGNPVNLVDINNEVGREYMNALLEAMKRLSGGAAGQIESAMERLETAYLAVEVAVASHEKSKETVVPKPVTEVPVAALDPEPAPVVVARAPEVIDTKPVTLEVVEKKVAPSPQDPVDLAAIVKGPSGFDAMPTPAPAPTPVAPTAPVAAFTSIATEERILTPQDLPAASSIASSPSGDPLNTKEIDDGLEQLLSDWVLFKKSGLFGTGPKGREHPLFKKVADLQIPLLLSGRFEGSTQEIKQSITDYMNGWRYEQGIIYEQGETFEHYLRRVIKQILDLQKKRRPA